jgi:hypothetical protein
MEDCERGVPSVGKLHVWEGNGEVCKVKHVV